MKKLLLIILLNAGVIALSEASFANEKIVCKNSSSEKNRGRTEFSFDENTREIAMPGPEVKRFIFSYFNPEMGYGGWQALITRINGMSALVTNEVIAEEGDDPKAYKASVIYFDQNMIKVGDALAVTCETIN